MKEITLEDHIADWKEVYEQDEESVYAASVYFDAVALSVELFGNAQQFNVVKAIIRIVREEKRLTEDK